MEIDLTRARLRPWRLGDAQSLVRHANNRKIWRNLRDSFPNPYTEEDAHDFLEGGIGNELSRSFAIEVDGEAAGGVGLQLGTDVAQRSAEIGYWLSEAYWGRGIATEAVRAMTGYGFSQLDLVRIDAQVFAWNAPSMRVLEKAGYQLEGRLRSAVFKDGQIIDSLLYAIVREDWIALIQDEESARHRAGELR